MKKPSKINYFLYKHSKQTNHSLSNTSIQPVENNFYDGNFTKRYRNILRLGLGLKWVKVLQTPHSLGFTDNNYHEGNISRLPKCDFFSLLDICKRNKRSHRYLKRKTRHVLTLSD